MSKYEEALSKFDFRQTADEISRTVADIAADAPKLQTAEVLQFLYSCIDLTSLGTEDSKESIWKFTEKVNDFDAAHPDLENVAAVCVYPNFVATVKEALRSDNVGIAAVAGGFPSSQTFSEIKIAETALAVADGADEIDIVLSCGEFLDNNIEDVCEEIIEIKETCRSARLKVILETGLLKTTENIYRAAILAMYSGADFVKTSTGKVYPGATPEAFYTMCLAVRDYYQLHQQQVGVKVSGGVRTAADAVVYYAIVKNILGDKWLSPEWFRIGASSLADNLLNAL